MTTKLSTKSIKELDYESLDKKIVLATQQGLPIHSRPYHILADDIGVDAELIMQRIKKMLADGRIRRIAAVPNHYRLGYVANGMSVWDVDDDLVDQLGEKIGSLEFVSHCYRRPRALPVWRYNLFAMVHAHRRKEVQELVDVISNVLGDSCRAHDILFSTKILKKTGLRFKPDTNT